MLRRGKILDVGSLRHRITIQQRSSTPDAFGQPDVTWVDVTTAWASIYALSRGEQFTAEQLSTKAVNIVTMRYQPSKVITAGMRVKFMTKIYAIQGVENFEEDNSVLKLTVIEETNNG